MSHVPSGGTRYLMLYAAIPAAAAFHLQLTLDGGSTPALRPIAPVALPSCAAVPAWRPLLALPPPDAASDTMSSLSHLRQHLERLAGVVAIRSLPIALLCVVVLILHRRIASRRAAARPCYLAMTSVSMPLSVDSGRCSGQDTHSASCPSASGMAGRTAQLGSVTLRLPMAAVGVRAGDSKLLQRAHATTGATSRTAWATPQAHRVIAPWPPAGL